MRRNDSTLSTLREPVENEQANNRDTLRSYCANPVFPLSVNGLPIPKNDMDEETRGTDTGARTRQQSGSG